MLSLKKMYGDELLQLALVLSLLRVDPDSYLGLESRPSRQFMTTEGGWDLEHAQTLISPRYVHPKSLDSVLMSYERHLFEDLNSLGRYQRPGGFDVQAYLLNVQGDGVRISGDVSATTDSTIEAAPLPIPSTETVNENHTDFSSSFFTSTDDYEFFDNELFPEHESIMDQNIADLSDYGDPLPLQSFGLLGGKDQFELENLFNAPITLPEYLNDQSRVEVKRERASTSFSSDRLLPDAWSVQWDFVKVKEEIKDELKIEVKEEPKSNELTQEDMDLIEVLWKQDVDLGFSLDMSNPKADSKNLGATDVELEKLKALQSLKSEIVGNGTLLNDAEKEDPIVDNSPLDDPWAGLSYTIDTETGEYVLKPLSEGPALPALPLEDFLLEEALHLAGLDDDCLKEECSTQDIKSSIESANCSVSDDQGVFSPEPATVAVTSTDCNSCSSNDGSCDADEEDLDSLCNMMTAQFHHPRPHPHLPHHPHHPHAHAFHQSRMPSLGRTMSMEQRWQDLANLLSLPGPPPPPDMTHHPHPHHHHPHPHAHAHHYGHAPFPVPGGYGAQGHPTHPAQGGGHYMDRTLQPGVLLQNATLTPPMGDINTNANATYGNGTNLGSAVASSMHLTNSSEPLDGPGAAASAYKMESGHDLLYYQNATTELNQTTDGFLNSILNDEDLQLMDMAVNEGMYTMRMLDTHNNASSNSSVLGAVGGSITGSGGTTGVSGDRLDASSDSAVSSMGSERVPSLSDGEWGDAGSDSAQDFHQNKYGPYDYSYSGRIGSDGGRQHPVAQKKHHMFAKRYFQEQNTPPTPLAPHHALPPAPIKYEYEPHYPILHPGAMDGNVGHKPAEMKYSCTMDFARQNSRGSMEHIAHNHTYHLPQSNGATPRPQTRDKKTRRTEEEHLSRDEKRARALNVPILVQDIINLPMDEFNERLSKYDLSEPQLSLIRDIRRRGKNKVAAQNCRKRKLDQIVTLADEVKDMRERKHRLLRERDHALSERQRVKDKFAQLYRHVFNNLRDADGQPYSSFQYSLQQSADGSVVLVPRSNNSLLESSTNNTDSQSRQHHQNNLPRKE